MPEAFDRLSRVRQPRGSMRALCLAVAAAALTGCLTHLPPKASLEHMQIHWASDFASAQVRAEEEGKPVLACLVAGQIDGLC
jgi:hypothetical protein